jgi:hypothetical protein
MGVEVPSYVSDDSDVRESSDGGLKALDPGLVAYWPARPELWALLSERGRQILSKEMFGDPFAARKVFGSAHLDIGLRDCSTLRVLFSGSENNLPGSAF